MLGYCHCSFPNGVRARRSFSEGLHVEVWLRSSSAVDSRRLYCNARFLIAGREDGQLVLDAIYGDNSAELDLLNDRDGTESCSFFWWLLR